jgi:hypothetical protein
MRNLPLGQISNVLLACVSLDGWLDRPWHAAPCAFVAVTKLHASRPKLNRTPLQHEQRIPGEWIQLRTLSVEKLATLYWWRRAARKGPGWSPSVALKHAIWWRLLQLLNRSLLDRHAAYCRSPLQFYSAFVQKGSCNYGFIFTQVFSLSRMFPVQWQGVSSYRLHGSRSLSLYLRCTQFKFRPGSSWQCLWASEPPSLYLRPHQHDFPKSVI